MAEFDENKCEENRLDESVFEDRNSDIKPDENGNYTWQCFICGAVLTQTEKPDYCPLCKKEETFFFKIKPQK